MKKLILTLLATLLLIISPVEADKASRFDDPVELTRWAGCDAKVVTSDQHGAVESYYDGEAIYLGTASGIPSAYGRAIMLHEIAHCLQNQALNGELGYAYMFDAVSFELDADRVSANLMCLRGEEGVRIYTELLDWAHDTYGYNGDSGHGSLQQRKDAAASALACRKDIQGA